MKNKKRSIKANRKNKYPAFFIVHWPSGPVACCADHANQLIQLSKIIGAHIIVTGANRGAVCRDCKNEDEKK